MLATTVRMAAASAAKPARWRDGRSRATTSAGVNAGSAAGSVAAIGERGLLVVAQAARHQQPGLVAGAPRRQRVAGGQDDVKGGGEEPQAGLDAAAPDQLGG